MNGARTATPRQGGWRARRNALRNEVLRSRKVERDREEDAAITARGPDPHRPHAELEDLTRDFRYGKARQHHAKTMAALDLALVAARRIVVENPEHIARLHRLEELRELTAEDAHGASAEWDEVFELAFEILAEQPSALQGSRSARGKVLRMLASKKLRALRGPSEEFRRASSTMVWHRYRANGQRKRFENVRACGTKEFTIRCKACVAGGRDHARTVDVMCGVRRVCKTCDVRRTKKRQAAFGRGRALIYVQAERMGHLRPNRKGGRFTEKLLTLTVPHVAPVDGVEGSIVRDAPNATHARVAMLFSAWSVLKRKMSRHWKMCGIEGVAFMRWFEWTPGATKKDKHGHPHFHCYLWSPFIDRTLIVEWWAEALAIVGYEPKRDKEGRPEVRVDLRMLRNIDSRMVNEMMKGRSENGRRAIELSRIELRDGSDADRAFTYAAGWSVQDIVALVKPEVVRDLYIATEGRHLEQGSLGFRDSEEVACCSICLTTGQWERSATLKRIPLNVESYAREERGPP